MSKHTKASLEKLGLEELKAAAIELLSEKTAISAELKELKAIPNFEEDLKAAEKIIGEQADVITQLEKNVSLNKVKSTSTEEIADEDFVIVGKSEFSLKPALKRVILDGNTYSREEALKNKEVMVALLKNNYPHLVKK